MTRAETIALYADARSTTPVTHAIAGGIAVVYSSPSPDKHEQPNEDAALLVQLGPERCVLALADGMGGLPGGRMASRLALDALRRCLDDDATDSLRPLILDGFEQANREILQRTPGSGTTLLVAAIDGKKLRPFHVGDSVALVTGQRGRIKLQTLAHSPTAYAVEAGVLSESEAMHHDERHIVTNALGCDEMRIELGAPRSLAARDTVLLGSDGLFDNLTMGEIVERIRCGPLSHGVTRLAELAFKRMGCPTDQVPGKPDDLTIVAFRRGLPNRPA